MKNLKKMLMILVFGMMTFLVVTPASAAKVLDYEWVCRGCGGNCLEEIVIEGKPVLLDTSN